MLLPEEKKQILSIALTPRERQLLNYIVSEYAQLGIDAFCRREKISRSYIRKLEASLLGKIYQTLAPGGTEAVMEFLYIRRLYPNYAEYIARREKELLRSNASRDALNVFYGKCFDHLIHFEQPEHIDIEWIRRFGIQYVKTSSKPVTDGRLYVNSALLGLEIALINIDKRMPLDKKIESAKKLLARDRARYYRTTNIKAKYYYLIARSRFYSQYRQDKLETLLGLLERAKEIMDVQPEMFTDSERIYFRLRLGRVYLLYDEHRKAYEIFSIIYESVPDWKQFGIPSFYGYIRSLIHVGKIEEAHKLLEKKSPEILKMRTKIFELALHLLYAEVMIHFGRYKEASAFISRARKLMVGKTYYHNYDISMRIAESTIAFLTRKWDEAERSIAKNLKWFKDNKEGSLSAAVVYLRFLRALLDERLGGKPLPAKYQRLSHNEHSILGAFPKEILQRLVDVSKKNV
jgi:hypothetical protein